MCGAPADAATSRSPVASITTSPRIASRPLLVSQITPLTWPSSTSVRENHECRRSVDAGLLHHLERDALPGVGIEGGGEADRVRLLLCCGSRRCPSASSVAPMPGRCPIRSARGYAARPSAAMRSIISMQMPRTEISLLVAVPHVVEHQHHAARGEAAQMVVALEQGHAARRCAPRPRPPPARPARRRPPRTSAFATTRTSCAGCWIHVADIAHLEISWLMCRTRYGRVSARFRAASDDDRAPSTATITGRSAPDRLALIVIAAYSSGRVEVEGGLDDHRADAVRGADPFADHRADHATSTPRCAAPRTGTAAR